LFQLLWGYDLLFDEKVTQPLRHTAISYPCNETTPDKFRRLSRKPLLFAGRENAAHSR
jgi:hypothetical protein